MANEACLVDMITCVRDSTSKGVDVSMLSKHVRELIGSDEQQITPFMIDTQSVRINSKFD